MNVKNVMLLFGSPRPGGNTAQMEEECAQVIRYQGLLPALLIKNEYKRYARPDRR